ncbi:MAG TPA: hypothetical protein VFB07_04520 [Vicinamibacterales bacterium]|nr:hypothetical protein [Vicinamibacterales bacterium]
MDLVRDVLDVRLVDRNGQGLGRVDSIVLRLRDNGPPQFVAMEVGLTAAARRLPKPIEFLARWLARTLRPRLQTVRYGPTLFRDIGVDIELDVSAADDPRLLRFEKWLSRHVVSRMPGGSA